MREKCGAIKGFPAPLAVLVQHLILSHHGSLEFGSPSLPQIPEAVALHFIDDIDSKMAGMRATMDAAAGDTLWTERNPALRRSLLRTDRFVGGAPEKTHPPRQNIRRASSNSIRTLRSGRDSRSHGRKNSFAPPLVA